MRRAKTIFIIRFNVFNPDMPDLLSSKSGSPITTEQNVPTSRHGQPILHDFTQTTTQNPRAPTGRMNVLKSFVESVTLRIIVPYTPCVAGRGGRGVGLSETTGDAEVMAKDTHRNFAATIAVLEVAKSC